MKKKKESKEINILMRAYQNVETKKIGKSKKNITKERDKLGNHIMEENQ